MGKIIGLDLGVENIGWALTDENYVVEQVKGRNALGVLRFDEAVTAAERRQFRTARRRLERRKYRITLLQEIFNDEVPKADKNFFARLNENDLMLSDRTVTGRYSLFNDDDYNDVKYYRQYPTIYHLRKKLMESAPDDIRLLYLAVHHIIKYRGHFLRGGELAADGSATNDSSVSETDKSATNIFPAFKSLNECLRVRNEQLQSVDADADIIEPFDLSRLDLVEEVICGTGAITAELLAAKKDVTEDKFKKSVFLTKSDKKEKVKELLGAKASVQKKIVDAIFGGKFNASAVFGTELFAKDSIEGFSFEDDLETCEDMQILKESPSEYQIVLQLKEIYDWYVLEDLLKGEKSISDAMIKLYDKHRRDLKQLKAFIRQYARTEYENVFGYKKIVGEKKPLIGLYTAYVGGGRLEECKVGNNGGLGETMPRADFYKGLKKIIEAITDEGATAVKEAILSDIDNDNYLPKIVSKNNSAIPYQLNMLELKKILDVAVKSPKYSFLLHTENGWTNIKKIESLLWFRIPYYVGPVKSYASGETPSKNAWAVRNKEGRVTPWSFAEIINEEASNKRFIERMTTSCTYLKNAKSLPKASILFSKFLCLNELNNLKIDGESISVEVKQGIFNNVYLSGKPTVKRIVSYLVNYWHYDKRVVLTGFDEELKASMQTYLLYKNVLGDFADKEPKLLEEIIKLSTIHNNARMLEKSIKDLVGDKLTEVQIKAIKGYTFSGWGSLSAEFLDGYQYGGIKLCFDGELVGLLDIMYDYKLNLQQIIASPLCNFKEALEQYNQENGIIENTEITYDDIAEMYCSPSVKKQVWQAFMLVKDIVKQAKTIPDKVFIESCREHTDKKKGKTTVKRRDKILNAYKAAQKLSPELKAEMERCAKKLANYTDMQLQSEKLFLYFMQLGKCMYTQKNIDLELLGADNAYDVDHIIPRAITKDDSFDNKVLVCQEANKEKTNIYPIPYELRQNALWKALKEASLISDDKYARLIRKSEITPEEQEKFINRQLVETNQTVLLVRDILTRYFKGVTDKKVEIVLSKGGNVSDFRKNYGLTKSREVNDFHHACDAYLNIVVGDLLNKEFNHNWNYANREKTLEKSKNFEIALSRKVTENGNRILNTVKTQLSLKDFQMVSLPHTGKGQLYKGTLFGVGKHGSLVPTCESKIVDGVETHPKCDTARYGGYTSLGTAYFVLVDSKDKKGNTVRSIEAVTILDDARIKNGKTTMTEVLRNSGLKDPIIPRIAGLKDGVIKIGSLLDFGGYRLILTSPTGVQLKLNNANQLFVSDEINRYVKEISVIIDKVNKIAKTVVAKDKDAVLNQTTDELIAQNIRRKNAVSDKEKASIIILTADENLRLYEFFIDKLSHSPYKNIPTYGSLLMVLKGGVDDFDSKRIYPQLVLLNNIIRAFQCNPQGVDVSTLKYKTSVNGKLKEENGAPNQCSIKISKFIDKQKITLILLSRSGLKEQKIILNL